MDFLTYSSLCSLSVFTEVAAEIKRKAESLALF